MTGNRVKSSLWFWLTVAIAQAILLFAVIPAAGAWITPLYNQGVFADGYDQLAASIVSGDGYRFSADTAPTLMREPGYPLFLAAIFLAFDNRLLPVIVANLLLVLGAGWSVSLIARRVSGSHTVALMSPVLLMFHPGIVIAESRGGVEALFVFLLTTFILTLYRAIDSEKWSDYAISGGVLGTTVLVRSTPMLFPLLLLAYLLVLEKPSKRIKIALNGAAMGVTMVLVLSPWIIRNYKVTGTFVPTASVLGTSAHAGQYICTHMSPERRWVDVDREAARERTRIATAIGYPFKDVEDGYYQLFYSTHDELAFSRFLLDRVVREYRGDPSKFVSCVASNIFNLWFAGKTSTSTLANLVVQLPYMLLATAGVLLCVGQGQAKKIGPLVLFVIYYITVYVPILAQARYSVPLLPFLSICAAIALLPAWERLHSRIRVARGLSEPIDQGVS